MPGVPYEMMHNMTTQIIPRLAKHFNTPNILHQTIITYGIPESQLAIMLTDWENSLPQHIHLAYLPNNGLVKLRLSGVSDNKENIKKEIQQLFDQLTPLLGDAIIAHEDITPQAYIGKLLKEKQQTISTAESCTGGNIAHLITSIPGSSAYYKGSITAYANEIKVKLLGVDEDAITQHGAVSQEVVEQMAKGARERMNTHYAIATSGIAGPDGETPDKPVGTTWIAIATHNKVVSKKFQFGKLREQNINRATQAALTLLIQLIK
jgi:nicotinamide-nucleotide amidase